MNIKSDVIIANQCNTNHIETIDTAYGKCTMVSTKTRGVGLNRNIAIEFSSADILLFADDDVKYYDDYKKIILDAFEEFKDADVICFGNEFSKHGKVYQSRIPNKGRLAFRKALKFGTCAIAIRRSSLIKSNVKFSELFGGGCIYCHGEDSDFLIQCFKHNLNMYSYNKSICITAQDTSTWFEGYNRKYFYDTGALAENSFGRILKYMYISEFVNSPEDSQYVREVQVFDEKIKADLKKRCPMNQPTVMFKKTDIQAVGGYVDWFCNEDYYLWIRMANAGFRFANIDESLVYMRVGEDSYQRRGGIKYFKSEARLQKYMYDKSIISFQRMSLNISKRFVVQVLLPNKLREYVFKKFARK